MLCCVAFHSTQPNLQETGTLRATLNTMKRRLEEIKRCTTNTVSPKQKQALEAFVRQNLASAKYQLAMTQKEAIRLREKAIRLEKEAIRLYSSKNYYENAAKEEKDKLEQLAKGKDKILEICASIVATRTLFNTYPPEVRETLHNVLDSSLKMPEQTISLNKSAKKLDDFTDFAVTDSFSSQTYKMDESYSPKLISQI